jgi:spermidine synthase
MSETTGKGIVHQLGKLFGWSANSRAKTESGQPLLTERFGILRLQFDEMSTQSAMKVDDPDELVLGYSRAMMSFLLLNPQPKNIAMIGLGGGSLAKYCYRHLPQAKITVIEINPDVIALRQRFVIPDDDERFEILLGDGAEFVKNVAGKFDVLLVDGFTSDGLPAKLSSEEFYDDCFSSLTGDGIMVVNLWGNNSRYNEYVLKIKNGFNNQVAVVGAEKSFNKIALAVKCDEFPSASTIQQHAQQLGLSHPLNFHEKSIKLIDALPHAAA